MKFSAVPICVHHIHQKQNQLDSRHLQFIKDYAFGVRGTTEWLNLVLNAQGSLFISLVGPAVDTAFIAQLACGMKTSRLALAYKTILE